MLFALSDSNAALLLGIISIFVNALVLVIKDYIDRKRIATVAKNVHKIEIATNSMKDALVEATKVAGELKGAADERAKQDAKDAPPNLDYKR